MRKPQPLRNAEEPIQIIHGRIAALGEQTARLRQEKSETAAETKARIREAERDAEAEVNGLTGAAEELQAAIDGAKSSPCRVDTDPLHQRVVRAGERAECGDRETQNERLRQENERNSPRIKELRRLARVKARAAKDAVRVLEASGRRAAEAFDEQIAALEEKIVLLRLETARIRADAEAEVEATEPHVGAGKGGLMYIDEALLAVKPPGTEADQAKAKVKQIEEALAAAERPPGPVSTGLRRALAQWLVVTADPVQVNPTRQLLQLVSVIPGCADVERPMVRHAVRLEGGLIALLPHWVPRFLRRVTVRLILKAVLAGENAAPIWRLASDPRMRSVWRELRRRCSEGGYFFPDRVGIPWATDRARNVNFTGGRPLLEKMDPSNLQQTFGIVYLFTSAVSFYGHPQSTHTAKEVAELRQCLAMMRQVPPPHRIEGSNGEVWEFCIADDDERHAVLVAIADEIERDIDSQKDLLVSRHRTKDPRLHAFQIRLSAVTQALFGQPLAGSVATIASVLFGQELPRSRMWTSTVQAALNHKDLAAKHAAAADRFAQRLLPVLKEIHKPGKTSLRGFADELNRRGVTTARGGKWYPSSVRNLLARAKPRA